MRAETMLFVHDVEATSKWYQLFLGFQSAHGGSEFEMLVDGDVLLLQLHKIEEGDHDHGVGLDGLLGAGVVVFVHVDDVEKARRTASDLGIEVVEELAWNEIAGMHAFTVLDPNGYTLSVCKSKWG